MRASLLGFTMPDGDFERILKSDKRMPIQTHSFAGAIVRALRSADVEVTLLSAAPVSNYPDNSHVVWRGGRFKAHGIQGRKLAFINLVGLKHVTRFIACLLTGTRALLKWRPHFLIVHGVHSPFLYYARLCSRFLGIRVVVILTDPPGVELPADSILVKILKRLDIRLVRNALRGCDGIIALTEDLATHFAPTIPHLVMEGIIGTLPALPTERARQRLTPAKVLYAGGLTASYGVDRIVEAVRSLPADNVRLSSFGRGDLEEWLMAVADEDSRIERPRFVSRDEVLREYHLVDVLVQPRPLAQHFVRFSFPSKLLEYLVSGTPVISTRLPSIPADYAPHVYWAESDSAEGLRQALERTLAIPWEERRSQAAATRKFIWATRGYKNQGKRMRRFLTQLVEREGEQAS